MALDSVYLCFWYKSKVVIRSVLFEMVESKMNIVCKMQGYETIVLGVSQLYKINSNAGDI